MIVEEFKSPYQKLKDLLEEKGLTQAMVARKIGMDRTTFNIKLNRTNGRDFSLEEAIKIAKALDEKVDSFL